MQKEKIFSKKRLLLVGSALLLACLFVIVACAPQESEKAQAENTEEETASLEKESADTISIAFAMDSDCSMCHIKPMESEQNAKTVASVHAQQDDMRCITCHSQEKELTEAHANATSADEPKRLKTAKMDEATCLECHESYEALEPKTEGLTLLTDAEGLTVNPHSAKQLNAEHEEDITCMKCHVEHAEKDEGKSQSYCMNCHHMKVYECNTCHD